METATKAMEKITENAARSSNEPRMVRTMQEGDIVRQGDLYIERLAEKPRGLVKRDDRQLALGSTEGSRHVCEPGPKLYDLAPTKRTPLTGPVIDAPERFVVTHPEHAHVSLPSGVYAVTYQRDFGEEALAAVRD